MGTITLELVTERLLQLGAIAMVVTALGVLAFVVRTLPRRERPDVPPSGDTDAWQGAKWWRTDRERSRS